MHPFSALPPSLLPPSSRETLYVQDRSDGQQASRAPDSPQLSAIIAVTDSLKLLLHPAVLPTGVDLGILVVRNGRAPAEGSRGYGVHRVLDLVPVNEKCPRNVAGPHLFRRDAV